LKAALLLVPWVGVMSAPLCLGTAASAKKKQEAKVQASDEHGGLVGAAASG
jgi:hypothetical protein